MFSSSTALQEKYGMFDLLARDDSIAAVGETYTRCKFSPEGDWLAVLESGDVQVYEDVVGVWTLRQTVFTGTNSYTDFALSSNGDWLVVSDDVTNTVTLYERSGTTFSQTDQITPTNGGGVNIYPIGITADGTRVAFMSCVDNSSFVAAWIEIHTVSSGTMTLEDTVSGLTYGSTGEQQGTTITDAGDRLCVGPTRVSGENNAAVCTRSGSTWTVEQQIEGPTGSARGRTNMSRDGVWLNIDNEVYSRSGTTWALALTVPLSAPIQGIRGTSWVDVDQLGNTLLITDVAGDDTNVFYVEQGNTTVLSVDHPAFTGANSTFAINAVWKSQGVLLAVGTRITGDALEITTLETGEV